MRNVCLYKNVNGEIVGREIASVFILIWIICVYVILCIYMFLQTHGVVVINGVTKDETSSFCFFMASQFEKRQFLKNNGVLDSWLNLLGFINFKVTIDVAHDFF